MYAIRSYYDLLEMARKIGFSELPETFEQFIAGKAKGRVVVELAGS